MSLVVLTLILAAAGGCGRANGAAGSAGSEAMLALLPGNATGVFFVDIQKAMSVPTTQTALAENRGKLDEFIEKTGIDPTRDVFSVAGALLGDAGGEEDADGVMVLKAKVDREALLDKIKEKQEVTEDAYRGVTLYEVASSTSTKITQLAFLDDGIVAMGTPFEVRTVIDVQQKRGDSVLKNGVLMKTVNSVNREGIFWAAFVLSEETMQGLTEENPMLGQLSGIKSMVMSVDFKDHTLLAEVECTSQSAEQNQQVVDFLNGMKSFAAMGAAENPDAAEMLRKIEITSGPENIRISAAIPEALLEKLKAEKN
jgi:hypothetical protein